MCIQTNRKLVTAIVLAIIFMIVEVIGGYMANSIAIMSDAAHLLGDVIGFIILLVTSKYAGRQSGNKSSFG